MIKKESDLDKKSIVDFHFNCLQGTYFSEIINRKDYVILLSDLVEDSYYNYIAQTQGDINLILKETKDLFLQRNRKQAIYITPCSNLYDKEDTLPKEFASWATDAWMILTDESYYQGFKIPEEIIIEDVQYSQKEEYVKTFHLSYAGDNPDDPYANLPEYYSKSLLRSFDAKNPNFKIYYVWAKYQNKIIGVASMYSDGITAGVYGLGTIEKYRKLGIGASLMKFLYEKAVAENISVLMLQTEYKSYVEKWYTKMGFNTVFLGKYFVKE